MPESPEQLNIKKPQEDMEKKPEDLEVQQESGSETPEDLEKLAKEKIESAEKESEGLNGNEKRIDDCNNTVNLPADNLEEIKASSGVVEKLGAVNEKGRSLLEETKAKMKTAVAIGMAAMAFSNAEGIKETHAAMFVGANKEIGVVEKSQLVKIDECLEDVKRREKIIYFKGSQQEINKIRRERESLEQMKKLFKELEQAEQVRQEKTERRDLKYNFEKIRDDLKKHIDSREYLDKLKVEFNGDVEKAKNIQKERLKYLDNIKPEFIKRENMNDEYLKHATPEWILKRAIAVFPDWLKKIMIYDKAGHESVGGFYSGEDNKVFLPKDPFSDKTTEHELFHASTEGTSGISEKAKTILKDSYNKLGDKEDEYNSRITERLVRKQILDRELENLGIKKYGEKFTEEHYKKMKEAYQNGKFSNDVDNFIKRTIKNPKIFMQIFNEIARNEEEKESPSSPV